MANTVRNNLDCLILLDANSKREKGGEYTISAAEFKFVNVRFKIL